jgi:hypothetical protein
MSTVNLYESLRVTDSLQSKTLIVDQTLATKDMVANSVLTTNITGVNFYGTFHGNVVGTVNGLVGDTVLTNDKLKWDDTSSRVQSLSANWQDSVNKITDWTDLINSVNSNIATWNSAYELSQSNQQIINDFKYKANIIISQNTTITSILSFKRILVNSNEDVILTFKDDIVESVEIEVIQLGSGRVFFASDNEDTSPILSVDNSNCLNQKNTFAKMLKLPTGWLLTGDVTFDVLDNSDVLYWYSSTENSNWFDTGKWYYDSKHTLASNSIPTSSTHVKITGYSPLINLNNENISLWVEPKSIDNRLSNNALYIQSENAFTLTQNCLLSATTSLPIIFTEQATLSSNTYCWFRSSLEQLNDWFNKDCWYIDETRSVRGNLLPDKDSHVKLYENNTINYIADSSDPNNLPIQTSLPNIIINENNVEQFVSPISIDATNVVNTFRLYGSSTVMVNFTFTTITNLGFDTVWLGNIITS